MRSFPGKISAKLKKENLKNGGICSLDDKQNQAPQGTQESSDAQESCDPDSASADPDSASADRDSASADPASADPDSAVSPAAGVDSRLQIQSQHSTRVNVYNIHVLSNPA